MNVASHTPPVPYTRSTTAYAGAVTRAVAFAADVAIVYALLFVIGVVVGLIISAFGTFSPDADVTTILATAAVWFFAFGLYLIAFWSLAEQTPGMRMLGIEVTTLEGERLRPRRSLVRLVGMAVAAIPLESSFDLRSR